MNKNKDIDREARIHKYHNMTDEEKQKYKDYQKNIKKTRQMNKNRDIENLKSDIEKI